MAFLDKNGLQTLTNKLVQGDAIKVASHRGHTVQNVIDNITRECENIATPNTMTLENRVNEFKVGKGRDLDVSGDVEEGKIEVGLSGRTYQNLLMPNLDKADNEGYVMYPKGEYKTYPDKNNYKRDAHMIKPNTTYTFIVDIKSIAKGMSLEINFAHSNHCFNYIAISEGIGVYKIKAVSKSDLSECTRIIGDRVKLGTYEEDTVYRIILLEGDYTQTPIEELPKYFEGIKSSFEDGIVDVEVQGKNLFDGNYTLEMSDKRLTTSYIKVEPNTAYTCSFNGVIFNRNSLIQYDSNKRQISYSSFPSFFVTSQDTHFVKLQWYNKQGSDLVITEDMIAKANIQLEEGKISTPYEPYYKKKISFNIGEPLRSLPNGVCDEIRNNNGQWELARRTAKVILNGSENWDNSYSGWNNKVFCCPNNYLPNIKYAPIDVSNVLSTLLPPINIGKLCSKLGYTGICTHAWGTKFLQVAKNGIETVEQLKSWLSQNPITVYYELAEPIITPIEPIEFEVKPLATTTINSDVAPISNHKVILNRAGQIEQGIIQIAELKSRVDALETAYDSYLLETQHKLSILGFEYELESEEV